LLISNQKLLNSIPAAHRPELDSRAAGTKIQVLLCEDMVALGSVLMPIVLKDANTNERIKFIFYALVVPNLLIPIFSSENALKDLNFKTNGAREHRIFIFDDGQEIFRVKGF
jgi:hypothetical protein